MRWKLSRKISLLALLILFSFDISSAQESPSFIVVKDNVNIRLSPEESCPIIGKADKNQIINILADKGDWYRIEPINHSFGWLHKKFVKKIPVPGSTEAIQLTEDKLNRRH